jgi:uncharacterized protein YndB with AHSA1/START domain
VDPIELSITVARPREEVFEYLVDIANLPEFTDHFLQDWHLTRDDSYGAGAGARFKHKARFNRFPWADVTLREVEPPHRILMVGRGGKFNRIRSLTELLLDPAAGGQTRVTVRTETDPPLPTDRILEAVLLERPRLRRHWRRALRRLRAILEEGRERGRRATLAGA